MILAKREGESNCATPRRPSSAGFSFLCLESQRQWPAFSNLANMTYNKLDSFLDVVERLNDFLSPIFDAASNNMEFKAIWKSVIGWNNP